MTAAELILKKALVASKFPSLDILQDFPADIEENKSVPQGDTIWGASIKGSRPVVNLQETLE